MKLQKLVSEMEDSLMLHARLRVHYLRAKCLIDDGMSMGEASEQAVREIESGQWHDTIMDEFRMLRKRNKIRR